MKYLKKYESIDRETDIKLFNILEDIRIELMIAKDAEKRFEYIKKNY